MVSEYSDIITDQIHQINNVFSFGKIGSIAALNGISGVCKDDMSMLRLHFALIEHQTVIADMLINAAVNIIRIQNHDVILFCSVRRNRNCGGTCQNRGSRHPYSCFFQYHFYFLHTKIFLVILLYHKHSHKNVTQNIIVFPIFPLCVCVYTYT